MLSIYCQCKRWSRSEFNLGILRRSGTRGGGRWNSVGYSKLIKILFAKVLSKNCHVDNPTWKMSVSPETRENSSTPPRSGSPAWIVAAYVDTDIWLIPISLGFQGTVVPVPLNVPDFQICIILACYTYWQRNQILEWDLLWSKCFWIWAALKVQSMVPRSCRFKATKSDKKRKFLSF